MNRVGSSSIATIRIDSVDVSVMSLERVTAAPFQRAGTSELSEQEFVVALSLHRDWFSPAQAKRIVELATSEGLLERSDDGLRPVIDPKDVTIPGDFEPDESVLQRRSTFEVMLERLVDQGCDKREAVGEINRLQRDLHITIEAAAAVHAARNGVEFDGELERAIEALTAPA